MNTAWRSSVLNNLSWLLACFVLAFIMWMVATAQSDPIVQQTFSIPMQLIVPDGYTVTESPRVTVTRVIARGQRSAIGLLTVEDILVRAELPMTPGTITVPLVATVNRRGVYAVDTQPTQITVTLEQTESAQKPVQISVSNAPPVDYAYETPTSGVLQALIQGATSKVNAVAAVRAEVDLTNQRNAVATDIVLVPVDADGVRVEDVTVEPRTTRVTIRIYARDDVRQLAVRPNIDLSTLGQGYVLTNIGYEPQVVYVSGSPDVLRTLGSTIDTQRISLSEQTQTVTTSVPLNLPQGVLILNEQNTVNVTLGIAPQNAVRQIDDIAIEVIGLPPGSTALLTPDSVSVVLSGPIQVINAVEAVDVRAILDVNAVAAGISELTPIVVIAQGQVTLDTTLIPATINITISTSAENMSEATPESTAAP